MLVTATHVPDDIDGDTAQAVVRLKQSDGRVVPQAGAGFSFTTRNAVPNDVWPGAPWLERASQVFHLQEICFGPWNSRQISAPMVEEGYRCMEIRQGVGSLSELSWR